MLYAMGVEVRLFSTWEPRAAAPAEAISPPGLPAQLVTGALAARSGRPQRLDSSGLLGRSGWSAAAVFASAVVNPQGPIRFTMFTIYNRCNAVFAAAVFRSLPQRLQSSLFN